MGNAVRLVETAGEALDPLGAAILIRVAQNENGT
jgi:hypothetical protein